MTRRTRALVALWGTGAVLLALCAVDDVVHRQRTQLARRRDLDREYLRGAGRPAFPTVVPITNWRNPA